MNNKQIDKTVGVVYDTIERLHTLKKNTDVTNKELEILNLNLTGIFSMLAEIAKRLPESDDNES
jgi:hypothetical protein